MFANYEECHPQSRERDTIYLRTCSNSHAISSKVLPSSRACSVKVDQLFYKLVFSKAYIRSKYSRVIDNRDIDYSSTEKLNYERHFPESSKSIPPRIFPIIYIDLINFPIHSQSVF